MAAQNMASLAALRCHRGQYVGETSTQMQGQMPLAGVETRRLYKGSKGWLKAEVVSKGAWDNVYFNSATQSMICGERSWQSYSDSSEVRFLEVGAPEKRLP